MASIPPFAARISRIAGRRSVAWRWFIDLFNGSEELFDEIRGGQFGIQLREFFAEIGQEPLAHGPLMSLDVYSRGSRRRKREDDHAAFYRDHATFLADSPLVDSLHMMSRLCQRESAAWAAGDLDGGRDARKDEFKVLETGLEAELNDLCHRMISEAQSHVWRTLGRILLVFVATETGHQSSLPKPGRFG